MASKAIVEKDGRGTERRKMTDNLYAPLTRTLCHVPIVAARGRGRAGPANRRRWLGGVGAEMHGGAAGSGAPSGSKKGNYKHARWYTQEVAATRRWLREATQLLRKTK